MNSPFPIPTDEQLENLGTGCFVQVTHEQKCFWVEIDGETDDQLTGVIHPELGDEQCSGCDKPSRVKFDRSQVKYTGCDRYCFC